MIIFIFGLCGFICLASLVGMCKAGKKDGICKYDGQK